MINIPVTTPGRSCQIWDGMVWCVVPARYRWPLLESGRIGHPGKIEHDLIGLVAKFGYGWAVYVRRAISAGKREYFFITAVMLPLLKRCLSYKRYIPNIALNLTPRTIRNGLFIFPG